MFHCDDDHFVLFYSLFQMKNLFKKIFTLHCWCFYWFMLFKFFLSDVDSIQMTYFIALFRIAGVIMFNVSLFTGWFWVPNSVYFLFNTKIAVDFTIFIWFEVVEVCVCVGMTIFFTVILFYSHGAIEQIAEMFDLNFSLRFIEGTLFLVIWLDIFLWHRHFHTHIQRAF